MSSEECGPNATRGLAESVRLDGFDKTCRRFSLAYDFPRFVR